MNLLQRFLKPAQPVNLEHGQLGESAANAHLKKLGLSSCWRIFQPSAAKWT